MINNVNRINNGLIDVCQIGPTFQRPFVHQLLELSQSFQRKIYKELCIIVYNSKSGAQMPLFDLFSYPMVHKCPRVGADRQTDRKTDRHPMNPLKNHADLVWSTGMQII